MSNTLRGAMGDLGFSSVEEFHRLVADVDLTVPGALAAFKEWQEEDGTKDGLVQIGSGLATEAEEQERDRA